MAQNKAPPPSQQSARGRNWGPSPALYFLPGEESLFVAAFRLLLGVFRLAPASAKFRRLRLMLTILTRDKMLEENIWRIDLASLAHINSECYYLCLMF